MVRSKTVIETTRCFGAERQIATGLAARCHQNKLAVVGETNGTTETLSSARTAFADNRLAQKLHAMQTLKRGSQSSVVEKLVQFRQELQSVPGVGERHALFG